MKTVLKTALFSVGITLLFFSCGKEQLEELPSSPKVETSKTLEDYPEEVTIDNWKSFVNAPQAVIDHHVQLEIDQQRKPRETPLNISHRNGLSGLVRGFNGAWVPMAGVSCTTSTPGCYDHSISVNAPMNNYILCNGCTGPLCMSYSTPTNNGVSVIDLLLTQRHLAGIQPFLTTRQFVAADVNRTGIIDVVDLLLIQQVVVGLLNTFPSSANVVFIPEGVYQVAETQAVTGTINPAILQVVGTHAPCSSQAQLNRRAVKTGDVNGSFAF